MIREAACCLIVFAYTSSYSGEKPHWLTESYPDPLPAGVEVSQWSTVLRLFTKVTNNTGQTLVYTGYSEKKPKWYQQKLTGNQWSVPSTDWCSTGTRAFELKDGASIEFEVLRTSTSGRRLLVLFSISGTRSGDLITIAEEIKH